jgi:hypothetical protein
MSKQQGTREKVAATSGRRTKTFIFILSKNDECPFYFSDCMTLFAPAGPRIQYDG